METQQGRPSVHPWERWTDGKERTVQHGKHFTCTVESFRQQLRNHARQNGLGVVSHLVGLDKVRFRFTDDGGS